MLPIKCILLGRRKAERLPRKASQPGQSVFAGPSQTARIVPTSNATARLLLYFEELHSAFCSQEAAITVWGCLEWEYMKLVAPAVNVKS